MNLADYLLHYYSCEEATGSNLIDRFDRLNLPCHGVSASIPGVISRARSSAYPAASPFGVVDTDYPGLQLSFSFWARRGEMAAGAYVAQLWFAALAFDAVTSDVQLLFGTNFNAGVAWPQDAWVHVVGTYDDVEGIVRVYQDAALVITSDPLPGLLSDPPAATPLWLLGDGPAAAFNGDIDEVAVFSGVKLSAGHVGWLYNNGAARSFKELHPGPVPRVRLLPTPIRRDQLWK